MGLLALRVIRGLRVGYQDIRFVRVSFQDHKGTLILRVLLNTARTRNASLI